MTYGGLYVPLPSPTDSPQGAFSVGGRQFLTVISTPGVNVALVWSADGDGLAQLDALIERLTEAAAALADRLVSEVVV